MVSTLARRTINFGDFLKGTVASARNGTLGNPIMTQRYVNAAHDQRQMRMLGEAAIDAATNRAIRFFLEKINSTKRSVQYTDHDVIVKVKSGWSRNHKCATTDIIVVDRHDNANHYHYVVTDDGRVLIDELRVNH